MKLGWHDNKVLEIAPSNGGVNILFTRYSTASLSRVPPYNPSVYPRAYFIVLQGFREIAIPLNINALHL
jgi:hypothetical protein